MCAVYKYDNENAPMPDDTSSGSVRPMPIASYKVSLISLGQTINFIDNWLKCFEDNYDKKIMIYKEKMSELFKTIPTLLPPKKLYDYKAKYQTDIKAIGGKCYVDKIISNLPPTKRRLLSKK